MKNQRKITLLKAERQILQKLKDLMPEYSDLDLEEIAHMELKTRLLEKNRELNKKALGEI